MAICRCGTQLFRCKRCGLVGCNNGSCKARMNHATIKEDGHAGASNQCRKCDSDGYNWEKVI